MFSMALSINQPLQGRASNGVFKRVLETVRDREIDFHPSLFSILFIRAPLQ